MFRVCHVQVLPLMSGVQRSMLETFNHLDPSRFEPRVVVQSPGPLTEELQSRGITYHVVPQLVREINPVKDIQAYRELRLLYARERFDIVHNQSAKPRVVSALAATHAGVPCVINHIRGYPFHEFTPRWRRAVYQQVERIAARRATETLFVNHEDQQQAARNRLIRHDAAHTIYNGANLERLHPHDFAARTSFRTMHGLEDDEVVISVLGRLEPQKQPLILPRIAAALEARDLSRPWQIVIAGDGQLQEPLQEAIRNARLWHRIRLIGWQPTPADVLHGSDVVLLPSLWEGLPRVLIEAHAAGVACVASDIRGNREVVSNETGALADPQDAQSYADALVPLISDPLLRAKKGIAARKRAEELFDSKRNNQQIVKLYERLLGVEPSTPLRHAA